MSDAQETVATEPTLEEVISEFNVQQVPQQQPVAQPVVQPATTPLPNVDPLDENSFRAFHQSVENGQSVLNQQLQEVTSKLTRMEQERADSQVEADINKAVNIANKDLDLDPQVVRVFLELEASQNPGFKAIWDARSSNPAHFQKTLAAFSRKIGKKFENKQDPELTKTQTAIQESQQSQATTTNEGGDNPIEDQLANAKSDAEWQRIWQKYSSGAQ